MHQDTRGTSDVVRGSRIPVPVRAYAFGTLAVALAAVGVLVAMAEPFPPAAALALLAIPLALCMNRFVFFPNEVGVTADAAVVFAAVIGFRADAVWLGPVLVALLVGPLDVRHWHERAFVRMAYNSGSTAIVTLVAVAVFVPAADTLGSSWPALLGAAATAGVAYVLAESVLGVVLVSLQGETARAAIRHQLPVNTVMVPLALYGTAAGLLSGAVGWWPATLVLLPVPLVPELLLVEIPRRWRGPYRATAVALLGVAALLGGLAVAFGFPTPSALIGLVAVALLIGIESRVTDRDAVPALAAVGVIAAVLVARGDARVLAAVLVSVGATGVAWCAVRRPAPGRALAVATLGALAGAGVYALLDPPARGAIPSTAAVAAGIACLVVTDRRLSTVVWCTPVLGAATALTLLWLELVPAGGPVLVGGMLGILGASAAWGAPAWRSRVLGRWASPRLDNWRRPALVGTACGAIVVAVGTTATTGDARTAGGLVTAALTQATLAMALAGVRQWRFAPRRRALEAFTLAGAALAVSLAASSLATRGWLGVGVTAAIVALAVRTAWPLARRSAAGAVPLR